MHDQPLPRSDSTIQGELVDNPDQTLGTVLLQNAGSQPLSAVHHTQEHTSQTPATVDDPLKVPGDVCLYNRRHSPPQVTVPVGFDPQPGAPLRDGWYLGKCLGSGMQGCVFALVSGPSTDAAPIDRVYKQVNNRAVATVAGALTGLEREWVIGQQLNAALCAPDGSLPGFMQVGAAVIDEEGRFVGLVLQQLHGKEVADVLADPTFADVDYVLECLRQVLTALDAADNALGFRHRDMRIENIMEHRDAPADKGPASALPPGFGPRVDLQGLTFKVV